ncbi:C40 family peptidase [Streptomyces sp. NPDC051104]|uniref:C40 family peptidase n=1 Tax=Streptomyces sp. NPDC051104 TaxID=3155044 RepID=UPI00342C8118
MAQRDSEGPSRDEVQRRIQSLYDRAETATGNFNATRAMSTGTRRRSDPVLGRQRRRSDPALDDVAREWFDAARAKLGPTVPAVLPADRMPAGAAGDGPVVPAGRPGNELPALERANSDRPVRELTAGPASGSDRPVRELTAGPVAELTAGPMATLPAAPASRQETPRALPGAPAEPGRSTPTTAKERSRRKLAAAREMLDRHAAQQGPAGGTWGTPEALGDSGQAWQQVQTAGVAAVLPGMSPAADLALTAVPSAVGPSPIAPSLDTSTGVAVPAPPATTPGPATSTAFAVPAPPASAPGPAATTAFAMSGPPATAPVPTASMPLTGPDTFAATAPLPAPAPGAVPAPGAPAPGSSASFATSLLPVTAPHATASMPLTGPATFAATATPAATAPAAVSAPGAPALPVADAFVGVPGTGYGTKAAKALAFARAQIGKPCVWGATGPDSYDAPGLTQAAWKAAGVVLPRSAPDQAAMGTPVSLTALQPGDLVFFHEGAGHVGICTGNGMMIHAPGPGAYIREESLHYAGQSAIHGAVRPA